MAKSILCCGEKREGNFCSNCGDRLESERIKKYKARIADLEYGIGRYIEAHHKKRAGSTIQYSIEWLEDLLPE